MAGVIIFGIGVAESRLDLLTDTELATLTGLVGTGVIVAWGVFDRFARGRVIDRTASPADAPGTPAP